MRPFSPETWPLAGDATARLVSPRAIVAAIASRGARRLRWLLWANMLIGSPSRLSLVDCTVS